MTDYQKLKSIIDEIDVLISAEITSSAPSFQAWKTKAERFLIKKYGKNSLEYEKFVKTSFSLLFCTTDTPDSAFIEACKDGLVTTKAIFLTYLDEMQEQKEVCAVKNCLNGQLAYEKIFIIHGHNGELKQSVARVIEKQGIKAIILSEQANKGRTIIEKIEDFSDVSGAICLFTADDIGGAKDATSYTSRARQNVVLETGYFMSKLGRDHVVILSDKNIEMPSDLSGVVYADVRNWEFELLKELKEMGYTIDLNKIV